MSRLCNTDDDVHVSSNAWHSGLWKRTARRRRVFLVQRRVLPLGRYILALITLQRIFRGILVRRRIVQKYFLRFDPPLQRSDSDHTSGRSAAPAVFERVWKQWEQKLMRQYLATRIPDPSQIERLTRRLQARWRMILLRSEYRRWSDYAQYTVYQWAAECIQHAWKAHRAADCNQQQSRQDDGFRFMVAPKTDSLDGLHPCDLRNTRRTRRRRYSEGFSTHTDWCAAVIQRAFRRILRRQIFRYYVNLLKAREHGDPRELLRCINPVEASLFDRATQLHVRFRFGGTCFPPIVLYKIFTHGTVADVGAMAPRNYVLERRRLQTPLHNTHLLLSAAGRSSEQRSSRPQNRGWYVRRDLNDWRPVSDYVLTHCEDILETQKARHLASGRSIPKSSVYHFSRLKRREEKEMHKKERRRQWLIQLYTHEQLALDSSQRREVTEHAHKLFASLSDEDVEHEVQRLLQWTVHLDYERYRLDWMKNATASIPDSPSLPLKAWMNNAA